MPITQEFEERNIIVKGLEANYRIQGQGEPFLILHGWGGSSDSWIQTQRLLSTFNLKVIIPDFPGFGKSQTPKEPWCVDNYVDWIDEFMKEISKLSEKSTEPFFLLGHSFGGRVAIKLTAKFPKKVKKLILCASAGIRPKLGFKEWVFFHLARMGDYLFSPRPLRKFRDGARNVFYQIIRQRDYLEAKGTMKETIKNVINEDLLPFLPGIEPKTLIIWGEHDRMIPLIYAHSMEKKITDAQLIIIPKVGHSPHLEVPDKLAEEVLRFINS